jgi:hypothetical protein
VDSALDVVAGTGRGPTRSVGATVILVDGALTAYLARGDRQLLTFLPDAEPARSKAARAVARTLIDRARAGGDAPRGMLIEEIDGMPPSAHALARFLAEAGFAAGALGYSPQSPVVSWQSQSSVSVDGRQSQSASRHSAPASRQSQSSVSSPFGRRYFDEQSPGAQSDDPTGAASTDDETDD